MTVSVSKLTGGTWSSSAGAITASVSPTGPGRAILVVNTESNSTSARTVTLVSGLGVTWTRRSRSTSPSNPGQMTEVWWGDVPAATSGTISLSLDNSIDDGTYSVLFATSTLGLSSLQWDTNASLPKLLNTSTGGTAAVSTDTASPYVLIFAGNGANIHNTGPVPVSTSLDTESNGGGTLYQESDVWGGTNAGALSNTTAGVTGLQPSATAIVDALGDTYPWTGTAPVMLDASAALAPTSPPFIGAPAKATDQMQGLAFPLVGTARSSAHAYSEQPIVGTETATGTSITRLWSSRSGNLFPSTNRSAAVKIITPITGMEIQIGTVSQGALRRWGGIGGIVLTPSFPQLNKNVTNFPSAI